MKNIYYLDGQKINKYICNLFLFLPIALILGRGLSDVIISIIAFYFLLTSIFFKKYFYYKNLYSFFFLLFIAYGLLSSALSDFPTFSLLEKGSVFYFRYFFFSLAVHYLIDSYPDLLNKFLKVLFLCMTILSLDSFFQYFFGHNVIGILPAENGRISSFFGDEAILGRYISYFTIIFLIIFLKKKLSKKEKIIFICLMPILISTIFISGDRVPLLRMLSFIVVLFFVLKNNIRIYLISFFIVFSVSLLMIFSIPTVKSRIIDQSLGSIKSNQLFYAPYGRDYEKIYITSFNIGMLNPIFGNGPNSFALYCSKPELKPLTHNCSHPHNFYLQLFSEQGLIGLFFLSFAYIYLFFLFLKNFLFKLFDNKKNNEDNFQKNGVLIAILIILCPIIPNMDFYNNWNNIFIFILVGMYLHFTKISCKKSLNE